MRKKYFVIQLVLLSFVIGAFGCAEETQQDQVVVPDVLDVSEQLPVPELTSLASYEFQDSTHRPEILFYENKLYVLVVDHDFQQDISIKHQGYIYDISDPLNIDFDNPDVNFVISKETDEYGSPSDHRVAIVNDELWVVFQSSIVDEAKREECVGGPLEPCVESQHLMFTRFTLDGEEILTTEIASTTEFPEDNYPDMSVVANGDTLLVSTGTSDLGLKIREVDLDGEILNTYEYQTSTDGIPGSIGNSLFRGEDGNLLVFSGTMNQTSVTVLDENFEAGNALLFDLPDDENTFQTGVDYKDGYYYVGYSAREKGDIAIETNPLSPRMIILNQDLEVVKTISISEEAGHGHVHPSIVFVEDYLFYAWSKSENGKPQVIIEIFEDANS